ncbi:hypothetical protein HCU64_23355 [Methylobacterium sp. C25]|uniref:hypothetical protein n=1 Tax=Methylobacterium sp. C25 TaxID=2721622 RepID=UPI001F381509|nr:hypothetical protein [Methylobacterium sp. C25]MCE4226684.1 hypothetical protein [Methylobacterium sp. C25]
MQKRGEPHLWARSRGDTDRGTWYIIDGQKQKSTGIAVADDPDQIAADLELKKYIREKALGSSSVKPARTLEDILIDDTLDIHFKIRVDKAKASAKRRNRRPQVTEGKNITALRAFWKGKSLAHINQMSCGEYVTSRLGQPLERRNQGGDPTKPPTVGVPEARSELNTLRQAIRDFASVHDLQITRRVYVPKAGVEPGDWLTQGELERVLLACEGQTWDPQTEDWHRDTRGRPVVNHNKARVRLGIARFILIGAFTGTRHDAALRLRWHRNDSAGYVSDDLRTLHRKGDKEPDTKKRRTPCKIPYKLQEYLKRWRDDDASIQCLHVLHHANGLPYQSYMYTTFREIMRDAGFGDRALRPHSLRYTCAHWMKDLEVPIWIAADYLGMSVRTLSRVYGAHSLESHRIVVEAFARMPDNFGDDLGRAPERIAEAARAARGA